LARSELERKGSKSFREARQIASLTLLMISVNYMLEKD
jgi:hypothetical protein